MSEIKNDGGFIYNCESSRGIHLEWFIFMVQL